MDNKKLALIHLSQIFCILLITFVLSKDGLIIAPAFSGVIIPFIIWVIYRKNPEINNHCKQIFNWSLNIVFITILSIPLLLTFFGLYFLLLLLILVITYELYVSLRVFLAQKWSYPYIIKFFH